MESIQQLVREEIQRHLEGETLEETRSGDIARKAVKAVGRFGSFMAAVTLMFSGALTEGFLVGMTGAGLSELAGIAAKLSIDASYMKKYFNELISVVEARDAVIKTIIKAPKDEQDDLIVENKAKLELLTKKMSRAGDNMKIFMSDPSNSKTVASLSAGEVAKMEVLIEAAEKGRVTTIEKEIAKLDRKAMLTSI